jgi:membrane associated rhomboid family serine protease
MGELEPCYRHADRLTGLHCTRCGNPTCPDCMIPAPVGHHCPACVAGARKDMRQVRRVTWSQPRVGTVVVALLVTLVVVHTLVEQDRSILVLYGNRRADIVAGEYYRLLTSAFLHSSWIHLAVNCFSLAYLGMLVEGTIGRARFAVLYLLSAAGGSVATMLVGPPFSVGASGAIFGVTGAAWVILRRRRLDTGPLVGLTVLNLLASFMFPDINWVSHVGGLATGVVVASGFALAESRSRPLLREAATAVVAAVVLGALVMAGVRWAPKERFDVVAVMEHQRRLLVQYGWTADGFLASGPVPSPQYQAVKDGAASYDAYVYQNPARARTVTIDFGDGSTDQATVPAGRGVRKVHFEHRFPRPEARFEQRLTLEGAASDVTMVTDVCPRGTTKATADAAALCVTS